LNNHHKPGSNDPVMFVGRLVDIKEIGEIIGELVAKPAT